MKRSSIILSDSVLVTNRNIVWIEFDLNNVIICEYLYISWTLYHCLLLGASLDRLTSTQSKLFPATLHRSELNEQRMFAFMNLPTNFDAEFSCFSRAALEPIYSPFRAAPEGHCTSGVTLWSRLPLSSKVGIYRPNIYREKHYLLVRLSKPAIIFSRLNSAVANTYVVLELLR